MYLFIYLFCFLGSHMQHIEVSGIGVRVGATAAGLHHSHSNTRSEQSLWPTLQFRATAGSLTHWAGPGIKFASSWLLVSFITAEPQWELIFHGHIHNIWKFLGQELNLSYSHGNAGSFSPLWGAMNWTHASAGTRAAAVEFLTHCATLRIPIRRF